MPVSSQLIKRLLVETLVLDIVSKLSICRSINIFTYILGIYTYIYISIYIEPSRVRCFDNSFDNSINDNDTWYDKTTKGRTPPLGIGDIATNSSIPG